MITAFEVRAVSETALLTALRAAPKPGERMVLVGVPAGLLRDAALPSSPSKPPSSRQPRARGTVPRKSGGAREVLYQLRGAVGYAQTAQDAFLTILRSLAAEDAGFCARLAPLVEGREVRHVARSPEQVHPGRLGLRSYTAQIGPGWFVNTNVSNRQKGAILRAACEAAGLVFGHDLQIELPNT